jgi:CH-like domain in sperm protein
MAQLVLDWLNEDVGLSRRIDSLEEDFRDGYMLGELMAFFNQQEDFDKFLTKGNPDAKINNFCLLEVSMKRLGISFNSKIAFDIMNGNVGVIRTLLYEIKTVIDRIAKSTHPLVVKTKDGENAEKLVRVVHLTKPLYDKSMSKTFENCVRAFIPNPSDLLLEEANSRFKEKERQFYNTVAQKEETGLQDHLAEFQRRKNIEKQRKRQEKEFNDTWNKMNVEQWKKNQLRARDRKMLKEKVDLRMTTMRESAVMTMRVDARETMLRG